MCNLLAKKQQWLAALTVHSMMPLVITGRILGYRKAESHVLAYSLKLLADGSFFSLPQMSLLISTVR